VNKAAGPGLVGHGPAHAEEPTPLTLFAVPPNSSANILYVGPAKPAGLHENDKLAQMRDKPDALA